MPEPITISFSVAGVDNIRDAFRTVDQSAIALERSWSRRAQEGSRYRVGVAKGEAKEKAKATDDAVKGADKAEKAHTAAVEREAKRRENIIRTSSRMAGQVAKAQADAEIREAQRAANARERAYARAGRESAKEQRDTQRARERFLSSAGGYVGSAVHKLGSAGFGVVKSALSVGGGFDVVDQVRGSLDAERAAVMLSNSAYQPGKTIQGWGARPDSGRILARAREVQDSTGVGKGELLEGARSYVAKSSDFLGSMENLPFFAQLAKGSGTGVKDIMGAAGILRAQNKNLTTEEMQQTMLNIVSQGKQGAMEIDDLARVAGKITKTSAAYGGSLNQTEAQRQLLGMAQIAIRTSGNPNEAATVVSNFADDTLKHQKALKSHGVNALNSQGGLIDPSEITRQVFESSGGNIGKIIGMGYGQRSMKFFEALAPIYQEKAASLRGGGMKDEKEIKKQSAQAVVDEIKSLTGATYSKGEMQTDADAVLQTGIERFEMAMTNLKEAVADRMLPHLEAFISKLPAFAPAVEGAASAFASILPVIQSFVGSFADLIKSDPIGGALLLGATKMGGAIGALATAFIVGKGIIDAIIDDMNGKRKAEIRREIEGHNAAQRIDAGLAGRGDYQVTRKDVNEVSAEADAALERASMQGASQTGYKRKDDEFYKDVRGMVMMGASDEQILGKHNRNTLVFGNDSEDSRAVALDRENEIKNYLRLTRTGQRGAASVAGATQRNQIASLVGGMAMGGLGGVVGGIGQAVAAGATGEQGVPKLDLGEASAKEIASQMTMAQTSAKMIADAMALGATAVGTSGGGGTPSPNRNQPIGGPGR